MDERPAAGPILDGAAPETDSLPVQRLDYEHKRWLMSAKISIQQGSLARPTAVVLGVLAAALLNGYALSVGASPGPPYPWASLISAVPVAGVVVLVAERWPRSAALGLLGLVAFSGAFAMEEVSRSATLAPLSVAVTCVLAAGVCSYSPAERDGRTCSQGFF